MDEGSGWSARRIELGTRNALRRFRMPSRVMHAVLAISVYGLVLTGMPLKYPGSFWARAMADIWGGPRGAGVAHRVFASALIATAVAHVGGLMWETLHGRAPRLRGPESMVPSLRDIKDLVAQVRYLRGWGEQPEFGRYTYWEKFDYLAVFWGLAIIGGSGLVMWFPALAARFVPGWVINVALIIHTEEALLAVGFLFAIHFFNTHLRPEAFPMDATIFTGLVPEDEARTRWARWYRSLSERGDLETLRSPEGAPVPRVAVRFAVVLMSLGVVILLLIISASLQDLWHQMLALFR